MSIFILSNQQIVTVEQESNVLWSANNGENKKTLKLISANNPHINPSYVTTLGGQYCYEYNGVYVRKFEGNSVAYLFLNENTNVEEFSLGIVLNRGAYGASILNSAKVIEEFSSIGGTANSRSTMQLVQLGACVRINTYREIEKPELFVLSKEGWKTLSDVNSEE